jgi:hypothetical protein
MKLRFCQAGANPTTLKLHRQRCSMLEHFYIGEKEILF